MNEFPHKYNPAVRSVMTSLSRLQGKRERNASGDIPATTPMSRQKMKRMESAPPALMAKKQAAPQVETTVFFLPSVDVKVSDSFWLLPMS